MDNIIEKRHGTGKNELVFNWRGWAPGEGAAIFPNIYNIFYVTLGS